MIEFDYPIPALGQVVDQLELERAINIIPIFGKAGYEWEVKATHGDERGKMHFRRHLGEKPYPHFHLIYNLIGEQFTVHLDIRKHRARDISPHLSEELERLYRHFTIERDAHNPTTQDLISSLAKQAIALAMFSSPDEINRKQRRQVTNLQKMNNSRKLRKEIRHIYRKKKDRTFRMVVYGGVVEDWEPLTEIIAKSHEAQ